MSRASLPSRVADRIEAVVDGIGRAVSWLAPAIVLLVFGLVVARYLFATGSVALGELVLWLHAAGFLVGAAFALKRDAHVRVDVLRPRFGARGRAWVELVGSLAFLLPFALFLVWTSLPYVAASWRIDEGSREPGGLPNVWLLKALIPLAGALLAIEGIAIALRAMATLRGALRPDAPESSHAP
jgi:TRAP-type mannitol/chloroaromatic compound transport system permease small subunit